MRKYLTTAFSGFLIAGALLMQTTYAKGAASSTVNHGAAVDDSVTTRKALIAIINRVIDASGTFDIDAVANLYTPNALVADEEPPFSWNGPTAGAQWISTVEKSCKDLKIKRLKGRVGRISVYLQSEESIYVVVPVNYTGEIKDQSFEEDGAFTFVFRMEGGKWLIKTQVWVARKGM